jgi:hypothetical protein
MTSSGPVTSPDAWLGPYLVEAGVVNADQLAKLPTPGTSRLWDAVVTAGLTTDADLVRLLSERSMMPIGAQCP